MQSVLHGVHAQGNVHSRAVGEERSQSSLNKQAEDQDSVPVEQKIRAHQRRAEVHRINVQTNIKCQYAKNHHKGYSHKLLTQRWIVTNAKLLEMSPRCLFFFLDLPTFVPFSTFFYHFMFFSLTSCPAERGSSSWSCR